MVLYVELWKARSEWKALSASEREAFMSRQKPIMQNLFKAGAEQVGFAVNEIAVDHRADYDYMAVWKIPSQAVADELERTVEASGGHAYFDQVNARGEMVDWSQVHT